MERSIGERVQEEDKALSKPVIEGIRVIDNSSRSKHRKVKEAIDIKHRGATLNRTGMYDLPDFYLPLLREEETRGARRD